MLEHYEETLEHEGTWLIWPRLVDMLDLEHVWVELVWQISRCENVHIVFYSTKEQERVYRLLERKEVDMSKVDYLIHRCNSEWARDIGPFFVVDNGQLKILNNNFNGWGKYPHKGDNELIHKIAKKLNIEIVDFPLVLEGGAIEKFGKSLMTTRSNLLKRNPQYTEQEITELLKQYLGVEEVIWLNGIEGEDITDGHIDGYARFVDENTILTIVDNLTEEDYVILNSTGKHILELPCNNVETSYLHLNYYIINGVMLIPHVVEDDEVNITWNFLQCIYDDVCVFPIDIDLLHELGGAIHCITQQQPKI